MELNAQTPSVEAVRQLTNKQQCELILELVQRVTALENLANAPRAEGLEMTDEHARAVTYGEFAALKHKDAVAKTGLSYGQIYSCRLGFTFKGVHKAAKEAGQKNIWMK